MKSISILQIGDIHFPDDDDDALGDVKDFGLPAITRAAVPNRLQLVFREIARVIEGNQPNALLICGDLTSRGNLATYHTCVDYLVQALDLHGRSLDSIHVVPGNHDVDRSLCTDRENLNSHKFDPLHEAWATLSREVLVTAGIRSKEFNVSDCGLRVLSMNSCVGCGEWHLLPESLRTEFSNLIELARDTSPDTSFDLVGDQLDTPMFEHADIVSVSRELQEMPNDWIPIVLAHHNLLPQELARIELYTELINSGQFRSCISSLERPVVYCHGHIHADPVEIVSDATKKNSQLICVSAPEIRQGFNELIVHYSNEGKPLGLEVVLYRLRSGGIVFETNRFKIPFAYRGSFLTNEIEELQACLSLNPRRFSQLRQSYIDHTSTNVQKATFARLLREAEWFGLATIENYKGDPNYWQIRRRLV